MKLQTQWGLIQLPMSSGHPFVDACPCAARHHCQRPRSLSQICILLPKLPRNSLLSLFCQNDPHLLNPLCNHSGRAMTGGPTLVTGQTPGAGILWLELHVCPELGSANPAHNLCCPKKISASPGRAWCCPFSLAPTCHEFYFILCVPPSKICTVDKMLLLPLLISSSSFNCSLETFSTVMAGIILASPQRVQLPLLFTGISLGLKLSFSWDIESHVPHIIPPSISLLLLESSQKIKKQPAYLSFPEKYIPSH